MISTIEEFDIAALLADPRLNDQAFQTATASQLWNDGVFPSRSAAQEAVAALAAQARGEKVVPELATFFRDQAKAIADRRALHAKQQVAFERQAQREQLRAAIAKVERQIAEKTGWLAQLDAFAAGAGEGFYRISTPAGAIELGSALCGAKRISALLTDEVLPKLREDLANAQHALKNFAASPSPS